MQIPLYGTEIIKNLPIGSIGKEPARLLSQTPESAFNWLEALRATDLAPAGHLALRNGLLGLQVTAFESPFQRGRVASQIFKNYQGSIVMTIETARVSCVFGLSHGRRTDLHHLSISRIPTYDYSSYWRLLKVAASKWL